MILYGFDEEVMFEIDEVEEPYDPSWDDGRYDDDPSPYDGTYSEE